MRRRYAVLSLCVAVGLAGFVRSARSGPAPTSAEAELWSARAHGAK